MDPHLSAAIGTLDEAGLAAHVYDRHWRLVHITEPQQRTTGSPLPLGEHVISPAFVEAVLGARSMHPDEALAHAIRQLPFILDACEGGVAELRAIADHRFHEAIETVQPQRLPALWTDVMVVRPPGFDRFPQRAVVARVDRADGELAGVVELWLPALRGDLLNLLAMADPDNLERMARVARADRRPSAILFADIEASSALARRLPTADYFRLIRRVMRAVDETIIGRGGLVGRHVGDGVTAYFPAELAGGEEQAAGAALATALRLGRMVAGAAASIDGAPELHVNVGLHWGATVRLGALLTAARLELTALGEEVKEAARIEACATGGRVLASKALVERLADDALDGLGLVTNAGYTALADVPGAPPKARRDAPTLAVREL
jgi:class 3 adenylate cyclase